MLPDFGVIKNSTVFVVWWWSLFSFPLTSFARAYFFRSPHSNIHDFAERLFCVFQHTPIYSTEMQNTLIRSARCLLMYVYASVKRIHLCNQSTKRPLQTKYGIKILVALQNSFILSNRKYISMHAHTHTLNEMRFTSVLMLERLCKIETMW